MYGRSGACLLAISLLTISPALLGQADRATAEPALVITKRPLAFPLPAPIDRPPIAMPPRQRPILPAPIGFPQVAKPAGTIFSGTVTAIARHPATSRQSIETVAITFHVDRAIRGTVPGESLTISQWIGLWSSGQRYRVGERVLLFLYPPSKLGLTSCVAGPMGRFAVDSSGRVLLSAQHLLAFRTDSVLGGKSRLGLSDFALAVRRASEEE